MDRMIVRTVEDKGEAIRDFYDSKRDRPRIYVESPRRAISLLSYPPNITGNVLHVDATKEENNLQIALLYLEVLDKPEIAKENITVILYVNDYNKNNSKST